jgi:hypothetical protein
MNDTNKLIKVAFLVLSPILGAVIGFFLGFGDGFVSTSSMDGLDDIISGFSGIFIGGFAGLIIGIIFYVSTANRKPTVTVTPQKTESISNAGTISAARSVHTNNPPKSWLVESVLATLLCCLPLGIVGIVYAAKVNGLYQNGDVIGAQRASEQAKTWVLWSFGVGLFFVLIGLAFEFLGELIY